MRRYRKHVVVFVLVVVAAWTATRVLEAGSSPADRPPVPASSTSPPISASDIAVMCLRPNTVCVTAYATAAR
jgi:hypothetical protein